MNIKSEIIKFINSINPKTINPDGVYSYGDDNLYPNLIRYLIDNSITATSASSIMTDYISGRGIEMAPEIQGFINEVAKQITEFKAVAIHVNRNLNGEITQFKTIPFHHIRIGKKDSRKYNGKYAICEDWANATDADIQLIDRFNNNLSIIENQFKKQGKKYKGQLLYLSFNQIYLYPISRVHSVMNDMDAEGQASIYKRNSLRNGFFGKQLIITPPFVDKLITPENDPKSYNDMINARERFTENLKQFMGAENIGNVLHMEMEFDSEDDINKKMLIKEFKSNIDDKLFSYTEKSAMEKISMAFKNIPKPFITNPDTTIFSQSGELWKEMQRVYQNNTLRERQQLERVLSYILPYTEEYRDLKIQIKPLIDE